MPTPTFHSAVVRCLVVVVAMLAISSPTQAATYYIPPGDTAALIAALDAAALQTGVAHTIELSAGSSYLLTEINNTQELIDVAVWEMLGGGDQGLPMIQGSVTINGNGAIIERSVNAPDFRIFLVDPRGKLTLNNVTLRNGRATNAEIWRGNLGGAIFSFGSVILNDSTLANNHADSSGGGIYTWLGQLHIFRSQVLRNDSGGECGGIMIDQKELIMIDSTIGENVTGDANDTEWGGLGGGICLYGGAVRIENSAIINNIAQGSIWWALGGGIYVVASALDGPIEISNNSTISGNQAAAGAGIYNSSGIIKLRNVTIANNRAQRSGGGIYGFMAEPVAALTNTILADNSPTNCDGDLWFISGGNNLDSDGSCRLEQASDLSNLNAWLEPLADNGGLTFTHALMQSSPAVDHANKSQCPARDQRGVTRGTACDIGAYEAKPLPSIPQPVLPVDATVATTNRPTLRWDATGAARFEIQLDTLDPPAFTVGYTTSRTFVPPGPLLPTAYFWRVRGFDEVGQASEWSSIQQFSVSATEGDGPFVNRQFTRTPQLTWGRVSWAAGYEIQVDNDPAFNSPEFVNHMLGPEEHTVTTSPLPEGLFYWRVRARRQDSAWGAWSRVDTVVVQLP